MSPASGAAPAAYPIDPELRRTARLYRRVDHQDALAVRHEAARRIKVARLAGLWHADDAEVRTRDTVAGDGTGRGPRMRIYRPRSAGRPLPALLYAHGGAFISGDLDFEHPRCLEMCRETATAVISVDYRLAPEHPFPAGLDDCVAVYRWLLDQGPSIGIDTTRVAVGGSSAGAALAAAVCLRARDLGLPLPALQMLLCPVTDNRLATPSMERFTDTPAWDARNCAHMWRHYLGPSAGDGEVSPYAAPARAADLSGLPPAYIMTAELDPLRDEGERYGRALSEAGVATEAHRFAGAFHAFDTLSSASVSLRARREHHHILRDALCQPVTT